jgi:hypothetical protein
MLTTSGLNGGSIFVLDGNIFPSMEDLAFVWASNMH